MKERDLQVIHLEYLELILLFSQANHNLTIHPRQGHVVQRELVKVSECFCIVTLTFNMKMICFQHFSLHYWILQSVCYLNVVFRQACLMRKRKHPPAFCMFYHLNQTGTEDRCQTAEVDLIQAFSTILAALNTLCPFL